LRREIRALLRKLRVPALFITHDQEEAMELGDQIAILNQGRLEQVGSPEEVYNDPQTEFVATFLGAANVLEGRWHEGLIQLDNDRYLAAPANAPPLSEGARVKVVFRPEDVVLGTAGGMLESPYHLGRGEVGDISFAGASESLAVRLNAYNQSGRLARPRVDTGQRPAPPVKPGDQGELVIKVLRTKWEARRLNLAVGDRVSVGLKSFKLLPG
jgi:ABC-type Fe3+/spermidine/putrescine transport system ATPase subunit